MTDFDTVNGYAWPKDDQDCRRAVFVKNPKLEQVIGLCPARNVVVQAGGNAGVFADVLAKHFGAVYTFEPDPQNFRALVRNVPDNVICLQAALGGRNEPPVDLKRIKGNCGAHQVSPNGQIPVIAVDTLSLPACDLVYLDVEGYEGRALGGMAVTLRRFRPVVAIEHKGLWNQYGVDPHPMLLELGYTRHVRLGNDNIYLHG